MKTPEEIEKLIKDSIYKEIKADNQSDKYFENAWMVWWGLMDTNFMNGIIKAFTKYEKDNEEKVFSLVSEITDLNEQIDVLKKNKKYTEEDLIKAQISVYNRYTEWNEEVASDARVCIKRLNESLNK